jgi:two-component system nitrogen regulation sensor histidine kinase NtrY
LNTTTKIRWLLLLVTIGLFTTALTARWSSTNLVNLFSLADDAKESLNAKENFIYDYLAVTNNVEDLKLLENNSEIALSTINLFAEENIYFQTYKKDQLVFWSDAFINIDQLLELKDGSTLVYQNDSYFEVIKRTFGGFTTAFFIPVYIESPISDNKGLNYRDAVINGPVLKIASIFDASVADITNIEGKFLFSVKINPETKFMPHSNLEIIMWIMGFLTLIILINSYLRHVAFIGYPTLAFTLLTLFFITLRLVGIYFHFPNAINNLAIFDPKIYSLNQYFPSFADTFINVFSILWLVVFLNTFKGKILKPINNIWVGYLVLVLAILLFIGVSITSSNIFMSLVYSSNINFNVSNLVNLNWLSALGIIIIMMGLLIYYILLRFLFSLSYYINIKTNHKLTILFASFTIYIYFLLVTSQFTIYPIIVLVLVSLITQTTYFKSSKLSFPSLVVITFLLATICSLKLSNYRKIKELEVRKTLLQKLVKKSTNDVVASLEKTDSLINNDAYLTQLIANNSADTASINAYLTKTYFNNFKIRHTVYGKADAPLSSNVADTRSLSYYQNFLTENGLKFSKVFYKTTDKSNQDNFHAIIKLNNKSKFVGTIYIKLSSIQQNKQENYPSLSEFGKYAQDDIYADYSYAFYRNKKLLNHSGPYIYKLINKDYKVKIKKFFTLNQDQYEHLIYKPNFNNTIVITHKKITFWRELAALSFFFIIFLITAILIYSYRWVFSSINISSFSFNNIHKTLLAFNNKILYKTRIQIALVLAVVSSLFIIGIITFSYISIQYKDQQKEVLSNRIKIITESFQDNLAGTSQAKNLDNSSLSFQDFSKLYGSDINLFNLQGKLISTTKSTMFEGGLLAQRMNPIAFIKLNIEKSSEFFQEEKLASLDYTSAYMPIKSLDNNILGYLQVPYFSNQEDYNQKIGSFLNLLINIYVIVFVAIGFFAFAIANQITGPLSLIQASISKTVIGRKNQPIAWKRNDEIGTLILEYNKMIAKLEENANKLAQSERETAWREMAKQVAHEIKNPLTPLRLGIQMLDRSWKEKDEKFDDKFNKFSKSFLEQIDSLSRIASEFSNFAKMPELKLEKINLVEILYKAVDIYSQMENIQILCDQAIDNNCVILADKDQLLRSFNNILKNAIEAIPQDRLGTININCTTINHNIQIAVSDNGNGIPVNQRKNIFVPNFTTKSSGTGLGLAFVKQAIENMKGNIYFTTEIDVGTTFYVTLPLV